MRIFCPEHKTSFLTPRRNPIRCENRGHILGEFIFDGDAKSPAETVWQYCCNCGHFCPIDLDQTALAVCPACGRRISQMYVCDRCFTFSFESSTPVQPKNFTLTHDGAPQPSCPGCLQESSVDLREHDCEKLNARFTTSLNACPICLEHLDVGPVFPSSVAQYLRKTKAANQLNVAFDYAIGLFLPAENGEFVLVNDRETRRLHLLPRSPRFASKRDFYELYQDCFHCTNVNAGELHVIEPALVERVADGWKLQSMGVLEIVGEQPKTDVGPNTVPRAPEFPVRERSPLFSGIPSSEATRTIAAPQYVFEDDPDLTVDHNRPPIFSWAFSEPPEPSPKSSGLKLLATVVIGLLFVMLGGLLLRGLLSQSGRSADSQQIASNLQPVAGVVSKVEPATDATAETRKKSNPPIDQAEADLRRLRERRIGAPPSDRLTILNLVATTEKKYPDDYRFPYERAKLAINGHETRSHDDAFNALFLAAGEAIKADKADEMLKSLETDTGDFHKLSHGHREWTQIIEALKRKDASLLASN